MPEGFASYSDVSVEELLSKIEAEMPNLPKQEARVAQYLLLNLESLSFETGATIAQNAGVSEITVGRLLRRFGCAGLKDFKLLLRQKYASARGALPPKTEDLPPQWRDQLAKEVGALQAVYDQLEAKDFELAVRLLTTAETVYVTGFQTVRGLAEDTARRLSLARSRVRYLSPHDGMLAEWIEDTPSGSCALLVIDVVPYAAECRRLIEIAKGRGHSCVMVTDEYCHWSAGSADATLTAPSSSGLFLESTIGLTACLGLLTHHVAESRPAKGSARLKEWKRMSQKLRLF